MKQINFKFGPYKIIDHSGNPRWVGILPNGKKVSRARLVMMNFLHATNIPKIFDTHHSNGNTEDDIITNLLLKSKIDHGKYHTPKNYSKYGISKTENPAAYQRARYADETIKEERLKKKREYYHEKLKTNPIYIQKNRDRVALHHKLYRKRKGESDENRNLQSQ